MSFWLVSLPNLIPLDSTRFHRDQKVSGLESTANLYGDPYISYFFRTVERQFHRAFPVGGNHTLMSNRRLPAMHFPFVAITWIGQEQNNVEELCSSLLHIIPAQSLLAFSFPLPPDALLASISINKK